MGCLLPSWCSLSVCVLGAMKMAACFSRSAPLWHTLALLEMQSE